MSTVAMAPSEVEPLMAERAELALEMRSPGDDSYAKIPFYGERGVGQVLIIDPIEETILGNYLRSSEGPLHEEAAVEWTLLRCLGLEPGTVDGRLMVREAK